MNGALVHGFFVALLVLLGPAALVALWIWAVCRRDKLPTTIERHAAIRESCTVVRNFSVSLNAVKLDTLRSAALDVSASETRLRTDQIVPVDDIHAQELLRSFRQSLPIQVMCVPREGLHDLYSGEMHVARLDFFTDCKTGTTSLVATLQGASVVAPKEPSQAVTEAQ